ncbi:MAG: MATE family efflux transporter, partial [Clostridia bacterium]|nr:MATE family efflux transporter [Clostridia bacterium]
MEKRERIQLSDHFGYRRLFRFVLPPIVMMIFTSVYSIVDGFFVSYFDGGLPFAALNLIFPLIMIVGSVGFMFGTGGSAVVAKYLGGGDEKRAKEIFSMVVYATVIIGVILSAIGIAVCRPVSVLLCKGEKNITAE